LHFSSPGCIIKNIEQIGGSTVSLLSDFFSEREIEFFSVLSYSDCRESDPRILARTDLVPRSAIIYLLPYYAGECINLSRYAASLDYHIVIKDINDSLRTFLSEHFPGSNSVGYGDHSPIDERHAALVCGLGIQGDNGLLINEKYGSYVFIADVLTDISPEKLGAITPKEMGHCPSCGACRRACPTGILRYEGTDCLSAITQKKGELSDLEISLMREYETVWGCDICQSSCPYNATPRITPIKFFHKDRIPHLTIDGLNSMSNEEFSQRAFAWRGRKTVERNLKELEC